MRRIALLTLLLVSAASQPVSADVKINLKTCQFTYNPNTEVCRGGFTYDQIVNGRYLQNIAVSRYYMAVDSVDACKYTVQSDIQNAPFNTASCSYTGIAVLPTLPTLPNLPVKPSLTVKPIVVITKPVRPVFR